MKKLLIAHSSSFSSLSCNVIGFQNQLSIGKTAYKYSIIKKQSCPFTKEIGSFIKKAQRKGLTPLIRLNGTSDIRFENIGFYKNGNYYRNIMEFFPDLQFYDYTKIPNREKSINGIQSFPENYDLTFSYSGAKGFQKFNDRALKEGWRVAVVFDKIENIPVTFHGRKVVSGDDTDIRHLDPKNVIVSLYAKGKARKDQSGFVVRNEF